MSAQILIPAPPSWRRMQAAAAARAFTDAPVLRNALWQAVRHIDEGTWSLVVLSGTSLRQPVASVHCVVDDFGDLVCLSPAQYDKAVDHWASTLAADVAATDWWLCLVDRAQAFDMACNGACNAASMAPGPQVLQ